MLKTGDRIGYTAAFVRVLGGSYDMAQRRGTVMGFIHDFVLVRWDDFCPEDHDHDPEYRDHVVAHGERVAARNVAKPGTVAFADPHARAPRIYRGKK